MPTNLLDNLRPVSGMRKTGRGGKGERGGGEEQKEEGEEEEEG